MMLEPSDTASGDGEDTGHTANTDAVGNERNGAGVGESGDVGEAGDVMDIDTAEDAPER